MSLSVLQDPEEGSQVKGLVQKVRDQSISLTVALVALVFAMAGGAVAGGIAANKVTSRHIKNNSIRSVDIKNGTIRAKDMARGAVTARNIGRGQVRASAIGRDQVTAAAVAPNAVGAEQIAPNSVGGQQIAPAAVGSAQVARNAIGSGQLADGQVTSEDIGDGEVRPENVTMPAPVTLSIPVGQPAAGPAGAEYAKVVDIGTYRKEADRSALQVTWTGSVASQSNRTANAPCVFQLRVNGVPAAGASGEVFVDSRSMLSVSSTALFNDLPVGEHTVQVWAKDPKGGPADRDIHCVVGPADTGIGQTVVVAEQVM
jgi:hypothetical protein